MRPPPLMLWELTRTVMDPRVLMWNVDPKGPGPDESLRSVVSLEMEMPLSAKASPVWTAAGSTGQPRVVLRCAGMLHFRCCPYRLPNGPDAGCWQRLTRTQMVTSVAPLPAIAEPGRHFEVRPTACPFTTGTLGGSRHAADY